MTESRESRRPITAQLDTRGQKRQLHMKFKDLVLNTRVFAACVAVRTSKHAGCTRRRLDCAPRKDGFVSVFCPTLQKHFHSSSIWTHSDPVTQPDVEFSPDSLSDIWYALKRPYFIRAQRLIGQIKLNQIWCASSSLKMSYIINNTEKNNVSQLDTAPAGRRDGLHLRR